jgi:hypothetical protein
MTEIPIHLIIAVPAAAALLMHAVMAARILARLPALKGAVRSRQDLAVVRELISLSMRLAVWYIALYGLFVAALACLAWRGMPLFRSVACLFWFGVITLPLGLIGKKFENRVRELPVDSADPAVGETFRRWLVQWKEPRYRLPD